MITWIFIPLVALVLVFPFSIAGFYFILGFKLLRIRIRENNFQKINSGSQTMMNAFLGFLLTIVTTLLAFKFYKVLSAIAYSTLSARHINPIN